MIRLGRRWPQHVQRNGHSKYANPRVKSIAAACTNALDRAGTCISSRQQELQYLRSFANMVDRPLTRRESLERVASDMVAVAFFFGAHSVLVNDRQFAVKTIQLPTIVHRFVYISAQNASRVESIRSDSCAKYSCFLCVIDTSPSSIVQAAVRTMDYLQGNEIAHASCASHLFPRTT